jgi:hypothetical protein
VPAGVTGRFVLASTDGPVEHVRTWCLEGHGFTQRVDALAPLADGPGVATTGDRRLTREGAAMTATELVEEPGAGEDALAGYLEQARAVPRAAGPLAPNPGPSWLPPDLERLRDFHLPAPA